MLCLPLQHSLTALQPTRGIIDCFVVVVVACLLARSLASSFTILFVDLARTFLARAFHVASFPFPTPRPNTLLRQYPSRSAPTASTAKQSHQFKRPQSSILSIISRSSARIVDRVGQDFALRLHHTAYRNIVRDETPIQDLCSIGRLSWTSTLLSTLATQQSGLPQPLDQTTSSPRKKHVASLPLTSTLHRRSTPSFI